MRESTAALASTLVASTDSSRPQISPVSSQIDDLLEEALKGGNAEPLPDPGQTGVIGQLLVQRVAQIPAVGQVEASGLDQLALGADAFEEHDELEFEIDDGVDGGSSAVGIELSRPLADKAQVKLLLQMAVEVVGRDEVLQRDGDRLVETAGLGETEHEEAPGRKSRR